MAYTINSALMQLAIDDACLTAFKAEVIRQIREQSNEWVHVEVDASVDVTVVDKETQVVIDGVLVEWT